MRFPPSLRGAEGDEAIPQFTRGTAVDLTSAQRNDGTGARPLLHDRCASPRRCEEPKATKQSRSLPEGPRLTSPLPSATTERERGRSCMTDALPPVVARSRRRRSNPAVYQ